MVLITKVTGAFVDQLRTGGPHIVDRSGVPFKGKLPLRCCRKMPVFRILRGKAGYIPVHLVLISDYNTIRKKQVADPRNMASNPTFDDRR